MMGCKSSISLAGTDKLHYDNSTQNVTFMVQDNVRETLDHTDISVVSPRSCQSIPGGPTIGTTPYEFINESPFQPRVIFLKSISHLIDRKLKCFLDGKTSYIFSETTCRMVDSKREVGGSKNCRIWVRLVCRYDTGDKATRVWE